MPIEGLKRMLHFLNKASHFLPWAASGRKQGEQCRPLKDLGLLALCRTMLFLFFNANAKHNILILEEFYFSYNPNQF